MPAYLHAIETINPGTACTQEELCERLATRVESPRLRRLVQQMHRQADILQRHVILPDFAGGSFFFNGSPGILAQSTGARNALYAREARALFVAAARKALAAKAIAPASVTHLITVSCTGFEAPGPDAWVQCDLALGPDVQRFHLGFMGCYAALPALELARLTCDAEPSAVVLVVAGELCSLHLQPQTEMDAIMSAALFADGGAAAVVTSDPRGALFRLCRGQATILPDSPRHITWTITDHGFAMTLSRQVPQVLSGATGTSIPSILERWRWPLLPDTAWAIHPGGPAILDALKQVLDLDESHLAASRQVLRDHGNMSSVSLLHVLRKMAARKLPPGQPLISLGFGPGITLQGLLLESC